MRQARNCYPLSASCHNVTRPVWPVATPLFGIHPGRLFKVARLSSKRRVFACSRFASVSAYFEQDEGLKPELRYNSNGPTAMVQL